MSGPGPSKPFAWQPLTPGGIAAFATASFRRLWFVQFVFALIAAVSVIWFLRTAWFPAMSAAILQLPAHGEIRDGKLNCPINEPTILADGHFLAISVDMEHQGRVRSPAHVQVEFGRENAYFFSLFGYYTFRYPADKAVAFNRADLEPKWGAWQPPVLWITFAAVIAGLMGSWTLLATFYFFPVWLAGFFLNRNLNFRASWKLAGAALMPGALLMLMAIFLYGLGALDLVQFFAAFAAHFLVGWIYAAASSFLAPKLEVSLTKNPFVLPAIESGKVFDEKTNGDR